MSSSSWGSPESIKPDDVIESCDDTSVPSALEAVQMYDSPSAHSPTTSMAFSDLSFVTSTAEEDKFLYGCTSLLKDEPLEINQIEAKKSASSEWSDEEENFLNNNSKYDVYDEEEESEISRYISVKEPSNSASIDESNTIHSKPQSYLNEAPSVSSMSKENDKKPNEMSNKCNQKLETREKPPRFIPFECHPILSVIKNSNEDKRDNIQSVSENQQNSGAVKQNVNTDNLLSQKYKSEINQGYVEPQGFLKKCTEKSSAVRRQNAASEGMLKQCTENSSDLRRENESQSNVASLIDALISEAKSNCSVCPSEPTSEKTILLKHSKTSSQTEKIVLKTCDKTSKTIMNYRHTPKIVSHKALASINNYLKGFERNPNDTQSECVRDAKRPSPENFEDGDRPKPFSLACKSSSKPPNLVSSRKITPPIQYKDGGIGGKWISQTRSRISRSRSRSSEYKGHHSRDRTPRRRSRDRSRRSRDRSNSYDSSPRRRSRFKNNSRERKSKYGSSGRYERSRSRRRSPYRYRSSRSRSRDRSTRRRSRDRSPDRRSRRSKSREKYQRTVSRRITPHRSYSRYRSESKESSDSSFSSSDSLCLEK